MVLNIPGSVAADDVAVARTGCADAVVPDVCGAAAVGLEVARVRRLASARGRRSGQGGQRRPYHDNRQQREL